MSEYLQRLERDKLRNMAIGRPQKINGLRITLERTGDDAWLVTRRDGFRSFAGNLEKMAEWLVERMGAAGSGAAKAVAAVVMLAAMLFGGLVHADEPTGLARALNAVCRIRDADAMGSGMVVADEGGFLWVLTNAHVVDHRGQHRVAVEFWSDGHKSREVPGYVGNVYYNRDGHRDIAFVAVDRTLLGDHVPPVIPLADETDTVDFSKIVSVGCPRATWPTLWQGRAIERGNRGGDIITFVPAPAGGRSGSAILSADGSRVIGLVAWRADGSTDQDGRDDSERGIAMTYHEIWAAVDGRSATSMGSELRSTPTAERKHRIYLICKHGQDRDLCQYCGPNGCDPNQGGGGFFFGRQPYRNEPYDLQPYGGQQGGGAWPTQPGSLGGTGGTGSVSQNWATREQIDALSKRVDSIEASGEERLAALRASIDAQWKAIDSKVSQAQSAATAAKEEAANSTAGLAVVSQSLSNKVDESHKAITEQVTTSVATARTEIESKTSQRVASAETAAAEAKTAAANAERTLKEKIEDAATAAAGEYAKAKAQNDGTNSAVETSLIVGGAGLIGFLGLSGWQAWVLRRALIFGGTRIVERIHDRRHPADGAGEAAPQRPFPGVAEQTSEYRTS